MISAMRFGFVHVPLVLGDLREDRQLLGLLEAAEAHASSMPVSGVIDDDRRVRPVGRGDRRSRNW